MNDHEVFLTAIREKRIVKIVFNAKSKGRINRTCVPFDYAPSKRDGKIITADKYQFFDLDSPDDSHVLPVEPEQMISIEMTEQTFDPAHYVKFRTEWVVARDWGIYS